MPEISIIVPIYNVEKYIHRCLDSILSQTFSDFELILVDDGSPDNCGEICDKFAKSDNRIRVIHKKNGGTADARNSGLDIAKGNYISFIDCDDYIDTDFHQNLLKACKINDVDISVCGRYDVYGNNKKVSFTFEGQKIWNNKEAVERLLTWDNIDSSPCDKLFQKNLFKEIRFPIGKFSEDIYIIIKILNNANKIMHIGKPMYYYCHRPKSNSTQSFCERSMDLLDASKNISDFIDTTYPDLKSKADSFYFNSIIFLYSLFCKRETKIKYKKSYDKIKKILLANLRNVLRSEYIGLRIKVLALMLVTKTYPIWIKIKKIIKR